MIHALHTSESLRTQRITGSTHNGTAKVTSKTGTAPSRSVSGVDKTETVANHLLRNEENTHTTPRTLLTFPLDCVNE